VTSCFSCRVMGLGVEQLVERWGPFSEHLMEVPEDDDELSEDGKRLLDEGYEDLDAGRTHTLEEVKQELDL